MVNCCFEICDRELLLACGGIVNRSEIKVACSLGFFYIVSVLNSYLNARSIKNLALEYLVCYCSAEYRDGFYIIYCNLYVFGIFEIGNREIVSSDGFIVKCSNVSVGCVYFLCNRVFVVRECSGDCYVRCIKICTLEDSLSKTAYVKLCYGEDRNGYFSFFGNIALGVCCCNGYVACSCCNYVCDRCCDLFLVVVFISCRNLYAALVIIAVQDNVFIVSGNFDAFESGSGSGDVHVSRELTPFAVIGYYESFVCFGVPVYVLNVGGHAFSKLYFGCRTVVIDSINLHVVENDGLACLNYSVDSFYANRGYCAYLYDIVNRNTLVVDNKCLCIFGFGRCDIKVSISFNFCYTVGILNFHLDAGEVKEFALKDFILYCTVEYSNCFYFGNCNLYGFGVAEIGNCKFLFSGGCSVESRNLNVGCVYFLCNRIFAFREGSDDCYVRCVKSFTLEDSLSKTAYAELCYGKNCNGYFSFLGNIVLGVGYLKSYLARSCCNYVGNCCTGYFFCCVVAVACINYYAFLIVSAADNNVLVIICNSDSGKLGSLGGYLYHSRELAPFAVVRYGKLLVAVFEVYKVGFNAGFKLDFGFFAIVVNAVNLYVAKIDDSACLNGL